MSFLDDLQTKLSDAIKDLSSLEVRTYRGKLETIVNTKAAERVDQWPPDGQQVGNLKLVRLTRSEFDGDTILFIDDGSTDAGPVPEHVGKAHEEAVKSAHEMRRGLAELAIRAVRPGG
jgi:hypothetical protein